MSELSLVTTPKPKKLTKKSLAKYQEQQYLENIPAVLEHFYPALIQGCKDKNPAIIKMAGQVASVLSKNDSPLVVLQINQNNNGTGSSGVTSFEQIIRKIEEQERAAGKQTITLTQE